MTEHRHREHIEGCYRCDLSRAEAEERGPYTPPTAEIREGYSEDLGGREDPQLAAEFDRWYAEEIRKAKAEAWDTGFCAGERDVWEHEEYGWDKPCVPNPYQAQQEAAS